MGNHRSAAFVGRIEEAAHLNLALAPLTHVLRIGAVDELADQLSAGAIHTAILEMGDAIGDGSIAQLSELRRAWPTVPFLVYLSLSAQTLHEALATRADGLIVRGADDSDVALRAALLRGHERIAAAAILGATLPRTPIALRPYLLYVANHTGAPMPVVDAVRASGMAARTLYARSRCVFWPTPERTIGWMRLLHAAWVLERLHTSPSQVLRDLRFPATSGFTNQLRRYCGLSLGALRVDRGFETLLAEWLRVLDVTRPH